MLKIGKLTDYALLVMTEMARTPLLTLSASHLAESLHLNGPTVSKILKILADDGLLTSVRGAEGGYRLAKPPAEISIVHIITAMEGALAMTDCCGIEKECQIGSVCTLRSNWQVINQMVHSFLSGFSIVDLLKPLTVDGVLHGK